MAGNLGTASLILTTDASQLKSGLSKAQRDTTSWGSGLKSTLGKVGTAGAAGLAAGVGFGLAQIGGSSLGGFVEGAKDRFKELNSIGNYAKIQGVSAEEASSFIGLITSQGSDFKSFLEASVTLQKAVQDAMAGTSVEAKHLFDILGTAPESYKGLNDIAASKKLFTDLSKVANPTDQFRAFAIAYGEDESKKNFNLLGKTGDQLSQLSKPFAKSSTDIAQAQVAHESLTAAVQAMNGAYDSLLIALAPVFSYLADNAVPAVNALKDAFQGMGTGVVSVFRGVLTVLGRMNDYLLIGRSYVQDLQSGFDIMGASIVSLFDKKIGQDMFRDIRKDLAGNEAMRGRGFAGTTEKDLNAGLDRFLAAFNGNVANKAAQLNGRPFAPGTEIKPKIESKPLEAALQGSKESASAIASFRNAGVRQADIQQRQLDEQKRANEILQNIFEGLGEGGIPLRVV